MSNSTNNAIETAITVTREQVKAMYDAGALRHNFIPSSKGMFNSTSFGMSASFEDKTHPRTKLTFTDINLIAQVRGIDYKMWSSVLFNSILIPESLVENLNVIDRELDDSLFSWDDIGGLSGLKRVKDVTTADGGILIRRTYVCIGGVLSASKLEDKSYAVPFRGFLDGIDFLRYYNAKNDTQFKTLTEQQMIDIVDSKYTDDKGNVFTTPKTIKVKGKYGVDPYLSNITYIFRLEA